MPCPAPVDPWTEVRTALATGGKLGAGCAQILLALRCFQGEGSDCYPSVSTLGELTGLSRRTCLRALADAEQAGFIAVDRKIGTVNHYRLTGRWFHALQQVAAPVHKRKRREPSTPRGVEASPGPTRKTEEPRAASPQLSEPAAPREGPRPKNREPERLGEVAMQPVDDTAARVWRQVSVMTLSKALHLSPTQWDRQQRALRSMVNRIFALPDRDKVLADVIGLAEEKYAARDQLENVYAVFQAAVNRLLKERADEPPRSTR